jgi:hypothetical protein
MYRFVEWTRHTDTNLTVPGEPFETDEAGRPNVNPRVQAEAQDYNRQHGLAFIDHTTYVTVDQQRAGCIADAYDRLPQDDSANPAVRNAYLALANEVQAQWSQAVAAGMTFEPWTKPGDAYDRNGTGDDVFLMADDVRAHRHLYFFTGGEPNIFMARLDSSTGLPINDLFRAIHDYYGHCAMGADFGPQGEENAWVSHMQMFSRTAQRALTVETRGQNSWVNFGRQNYTDLGDYANIRPAHRAFAIQKCAIFTGADEWINER